VQGRHSRQSKKLKQVRSERQKKREKRGGSPKKYNFVCKPIKQRISLGGLENFLALKAFVCDVGYGDDGESGEHAAEPDEQLRDNGGRCHFVTDAAHWGDHHGAVHRT